MRDFVELAELVEVFNGKTPSKSEQRPKGFPVLKIKDVDDFGHFRGEFDSFVESAMVEQFRAKVIQRDDTLILNAAHNADYVGSKTFFARHGGVGALATGEWLVIRAKKDTADAAFVYFWTQHQQTRKQLRNLVRGIHLYPRDVAGMPIPRIHLAEQRRIAAILERADHLRRTRRFARQASNTFLQSVFLKMFRDAEDWPLTPVEELLKSEKNSIRTGPFGSQLLHSEFVAKGPVRVLGIDNAVENRFNWGEPRFITAEKYQALQRYRVFPEDVLITIMATVGRCAVVPPNIGLAINTKHICCITLDQNKCLPLYLQAAFLIHPFVLHQLGVSGRGAVMPGLNMGIIKELEIPLPPVEKQREFAVIVGKYERLRAQQIEAERQAEHLFQTLLHQAFAVESEA